MMKDNVLEAVNNHINAEIYSAYLYLAMASYFDSLSMEGFASWMKLQAQEEGYPHWSSGDPCSVSENG